MPPFGLALKEVSQSSIEVEWRFADQWDAFKYEITSGDEFSLSDYVSSQAMTLRSLQPNTHYFIRVMATTSRGLSDWSSQLEIVTLASVPRELRVVGTKSDSI